MSRSSAHIIPLPTTIAAWPSRRRGRWAAAHLEYVNADALLLGAHPAWCLLVESATTR